jgi:hypothetical protein
VKIAVSIPDRLFMFAERVGRRLRISRSALYARALHEFVGRFDQEEVTAKLNEVYADPALSTLDPALIRMQRLSSKREEWK